VDKEGTVVAMFINGLCHATCVFRLGIVPSR
jgi:hypothetical protein